MLRQTILFAATASGLLFVACSDSTSTPPFGSSGVSGATSSSSSISSGIGGSEVGGAGGSGGTGNAGGSGGMGNVGDLGTITIVDVADTACNKIVGTSVSLYPDNSEAPPFNILTTVGTKRLAGGRFVPGFATFGLDGSSPSPTVVGLDPFFDLVASEGNTIGLVAADGTSIQFQRYDSNDAPLGKPIQLGSALGSGVAIAGDEAGGSLVVWADATNLNGRFVDASANAGGAYTFANGISTNAMTTAMTHAGNSFALVWSAGDNGNTHTRFTKLNSTGVVGSIVDITGTSKLHFVEKIIATSTGYALVMRQGATVVILNANGQVVGSAHRFLGIDYGWDIGIIGTNLAIVAKRFDGAAAFRLLDATGAPAGDWKCLDAPSGQIYDEAAIDADGTGWAIVYRTPGGGEKLVRTNLAGTAAP